ncbi:MAG: SDR family NAD(P)-dependent oxidoreductase, partial [Comamonadaceae bacterium]
MRARGRLRSELADQAAERRHRPHRRTARPWRDRRRHEGRPEPDRRGEARPAGADHEVRPARGRQAAAAEGRGLPCHGRLGRDHLPRRRTHRRPARPAGARPAARGGRRLIGPAVQLSGKVVVVTGAFGQLGRAVTREVLAQGARAALIDLSAPPADMPADAAAFQADLCDLADGTRAIDAAAERFGRIDGLVNVAGGFRWQPLAGSTDAAEWQAMFDLNLRTCVHASKAVLPHLQRAGTGRIVNIGAGAAGKAAAGMGAYAASKAGVARLTE